MLKCYEEPKCGRSQGTVCMDIQLSYSGSYCQNLSWFRRRCQPPTTDISCSCMWLKITWHLINTLMNVMIGKRQTTHINDMKSSISISNSINKQQYRIVNSNPTIMIYIWSFKQLMFPVHLNLWLWYAVWKVELKPKRFDHANTRSCINIKTCHISFWLTACYWKHAWSKRS